MKLATKIIPYALAATSVLPACSSSANLAQRSENKTVVSLDTLRVQLVEKRGIGYGGFTEYTLALSNDEWATLLGQNYFYTGHNDRYGAEQRLAGVQQGDSIVVGRNSKGQVIQFIQNLSRWKQK
jgi:hypothetical protein